MKFFSLFFPPKSYNEPNLVLKALSHFVLGIRVKKIKYYLQWIDQNGESKNETK